MTKQTNFYSRILLSKMNPEIFSEVEKGKQLKHAETTDKSVPVLEKDVHIKTVDRTPFLQELTGEHSLSHAETVDRSGPVIETVQVKKNVHDALLKEVTSVAKKE
jgi:hypothetical protein